jgi:hypothetical protein
VESPRGIGRRGSNCNGFVVFAFAVVDPAEVPAVFGACFGASAITAWSNIVAAANRTATAVFAFATHYEMLQRAMVFGYSQWAAGAQAWAARDCEFGHAYLMLDVRTPLH